MTCDEPGCNVAPLEGERQCSDHLTGLSFLEANAGASGKKNAARPSREKRATFGLKPGTLAALIVAFLKANLRCSFTPQELARFLPHPVGSISKEISRLKDKTDQYGQPYIVQKGHGAWMATVPPEEWVKAEAPQVCLHALQISQKMPLAGGLGPTGAGWAYDERNGQHRRVEWWGQHRVSIAVSPTTGTVQVSLKSSSQALTVQGFDNFREWLRGMMRGLGLPFEPDTAQVDNVELNRDSRRLIIGDASRYKLQEFENVWSQVYQKERGLLRLEARLSRAHHDLPVAALAGAVNVLAHQPLNIVAMAEAYRPQMAPTVLGELI